MMEVLEGWSRLCEINNNPLCIWDYNINVRVSSVVPNVFRLGEIFRIYAQHKVQGWMVEHEEPMLASFWCLQNWVLSHLGEDPYCDDRRLIDDFMGGYYGPAAPALTQYLEMVVDACEKSPLRMRCVENFCKADFVTYDMVLEGNRLFDQAEAAVQYNEDYLRRVRQARASLDVTILLRYDSLLYVADKRGESLPINRQVAALRYALTTKETILQTEPYRMEAGITQHPYWEGGIPMLWQTMPYKAHPLPDCFAGRDVLQVPLYDYVTQEARQLGIVYDYDSDSVTGYTARAQLDRMPEYVRDQFIAKPAGEPGSTFGFRLRHNGSNMERLISQEELPKNHYGILKVFEIDGLTEDSNTLLSLGRYLFVPHLSGFAHVLEGKNVTVWVSIKATGAAYGGNAGDTDAIWYDRMFLEVR